MLGWRPTSTLAAPVSSKFIWGGRSREGWNWPGGKADWAWKGAEGTAPSAAVSLTPSQAGQPNSGLLNSEPIQTWAQSRGDLLLPATVPLG